MILPKREDVFHKIQLYRLLTAILDAETLPQFIYFKGGSCAAILGFLDRFSIDLDFDVAKHIPLQKFERELREIFQYLDLVVDKKSSRTFFYVLKYQSKPRFRNSIKLSLVPLEYKSNVYKPLYLDEIDRYAVCQTVETMFGNKLVAIIDRYKKLKTIAGRDLYDIHHFFLRGYQYNEKIIEERTGKRPKLYIKELIYFIEKHITQKTIDEDLSFLMPPARFTKIRKLLKKETLIFLKDEMERL